MKFFKNTEINELISECGFWGQYTGETKPEATNMYEKIRWLIIATVKFTYLLLKEERSWKINEPTKPNLLVIYLTKNQENAVNSWLKYKKDYKSISNRYNSDYKIPWGRLALLCLKNLFSTYSKLASSKESSKYIPWIEEFVRYAAGKELAAEMFEKIYPSAILFSNDHSGISRAINYIAREKKIKLIYTQHACVGNGFPPLNYDLSMLDGLQSLEQYKASGEINGIISLTGRQRKIFRKKLTARKETTVGLATNSLDQIKDWEKLLAILKTNGYNAILRCHPAEKRKIQWENLARKYNADFDNGSLKEFIGNIDVLIAGLTGTILDAYVMGVPSVMLLPKTKESKTTNDYYGFIRHGITTKCNEFEKIDAAIKRTIETGTSINNAAIFEAGIYIDPVDKKNTILINFLKNKNLSNSCCNFTESNIVAGCICYESNEYINHIIKQNKSYAFQ